MPKDIFQGQMSNQATFMQPNLESLRQGAPRTRLRCFGKGHTESDGDESPDE